MTSLSELDLSCPKIERNEVYQNYCGNYIVNVIVMESEGDFAFHQKELQIMIFDKIVMSM